MYSINSTFTPSVVLLAIALNLFVKDISIAAENNFWRLTSPDGRCSISVTHDSGKLSYDVRRAGRIVIQKSQLGVQCDDKKLDRTLVFDRAEQIENRREKYESFAGVVPRVDHMVNHRTLVFHNSRNVPIEIELAASDEGVAFRPSWFIAGINGTGDVLPVNPDLSAFKELRHRLMIAEGRDPKMNVAVTSLENQDAWIHQIPPRGGFILRLDR